MKTVHIVYGPPLAGKSTFVRENMGPDDLVFDMDAVQNALCYGADHAGKPHTLGAAIALRNALSHTSITRDKTPAATHGSLYQAQARNISLAAFSAQELR